MRVKYSLFSVVVLVSWFLSSGFAISDEIENMILHGDFEQDADLGQWGLDAKGAVATMTRDRKDSAMGESSLFIEILSLDPGFAHVPNPSYNQRLTFEEGETYTCSAFFKAEEKRDVAIKIRKFEVWTVCSQKTVNVGTEWEEHYLTFTSEEDVEALAGLCFNNTGSDVSYWIDDVKFYEGKYEPTFPGVKAVTARDKLAAKWAEIKAR